MSSLRVLILGGLTSYRALFNWLSPWILIPSFIIDPVFQIMLFVFIGRTAALADDAFYVVGNAVQYAAIPCLFAMGSTVSGERQQATLPLLLASPARRIPLFLGRALPVILNGWAVAFIALLIGSIVLHLTLPISTLGPLAFVVAVSAFSCTGLGMVTAALGLRVRETAVVANIVFGVLLIFGGVNIPTSDLPGRMSAVSPWLPLTHGIAAAREVAAGAGLVTTAPLIAKEAGLGICYIAIGLSLLAFFERQSRRLATLDTM